MGKSQRRGYSPSIVSGPVGMRYAVLGSSRGRCPQPDSQVQTPAAAASRRAVMSVQSPPGIAGRWPMRVGRWPGTIFRGLVDDVEGGLVDSIRLSGVLHFLPPEVCGEVQGARIRCLPAVQRQLSQGNGGGDWRWRRLVQAVINRCSIGMRSGHGDLGSMLPVPEPGIDWVLAGPATSPARRCSCIRLIAIAGSRWLD